VSGDAIGASSLSLDAVRALMPDILAPLMPSSSE
jgi:hypothetical protein